MAMRTRDPLNLLAFTEHDVRGIEVAVRDAFLVSGRDGFLRRDPNREHPIERQAP